VSTGSANQRRDIQGLRAVAVGLVVLYHAGVVGLPGGFVGVDVFFVISGYLITGLLLKEMLQTGSIHLADFYARRARRLLPAAAVTLLGVVTLARTMLPDLRWADIARDVLASSAYVVNWTLADRSTDYLAQDLAPSPLQHFWSLAVEEQYYVVWPVLMLITTMWVRRRGLSRRGLFRARGRRERSPLPVLLTALVLLASASLAWSWWLTSHDPGRAYFVTTTRIWELALGAMLAVAAPRVRLLPAQLLLACSWLGLGLVVAAAVVIDAQTPFPGLAALLPTTGAVLVLAGGLAPGRWGAERVLGVPPMQWLGALSYSLYLWHWPLLVLAAARFGELSSGQRLGVAALSVVPAVLSYRLVENPVRLSDRFEGTPAFTLQVGALCSVVSIIAGLVLLNAAQSVPSPSTFQARTLTASSGKAATVMHGAAVLGAEPLGDPAGRPVDGGGEFVPAPRDARADMPSAYTDGCLVDRDVADPQPCSYGSREAAGQVVLVGDSHAAQWADAVLAFASSRGWGMRTYLKAACPPVLGPRVLTGSPARRYTQCETWNRGVLAELATAAPRPRLVVVAGALSSLVVDGRVLHWPASREALIGGMHAYLVQLARTGVPIVLMADTPYMASDVPDCLARNDSRRTRCATPRPLAVVAGKEAAAARGVRGVEVVDLVPAICPTDQCAPVIGKVLVYRDANHLTGTYARSLVPRLSVRLAALLGR